MKVECGSILPHVIGLAAFRDSQDACLPRNRCQRDLCRGDVACPRDPLDAGVLEQRPGLIGETPSSESGVHGTRAGRSGLNASFGQIVRDLIGGDRRATLEIG